MAYIIIAGSIVALIALVAVLLFNRLVRLRNKVDTAWRQIDVQLKRRYDLVPRLVAIAQGYAVHEKDVLTAVTRARAEAQSASSLRTKGPAEDGLSTALGGIMLLAENYPDLKAEQEFAKLADELVRTETAIAGSRKYYNGSVMQYDNARQSFPGNLVAGALAGSFKPREYFELNEAEMRAAPEAAWS
ncbi:MAG: LemA family protein [Thermoleophilia bacterium]